jgi:hypothetical protein
MKPIKKIIQETGRREFSDKWGVSLSVVDKWLAGTRNPDKIKMRMYNDYKSLEDYDNKHGRKGELS